MPNALPLAEQDLAMAPGFSSLRPEVGEKLPSSGWGQNSTKQQTLGKSALLTSLGLLHIACEVQKVKLHRRPRCLAAAQQKLLAVQSKYAKVSQKL